MKLKSLLFILFWLASRYLLAQTIITGVVADSLNNPIPLASVYLSKTTIGTLTDNNGAYTISIPQNGVYEMVASCIGYKQNILVINSDGIKQTINIILFPDTILLSEVTIRARDKNRRKNYSQFIRTFIGVSENSKSCKILNPEDLYLFRDTENDVLKGYSIKPLRIVNKALGYTITYDLVDYSYEYNANLAKFSGYNYFQPLKGTLRSNEFWKMNRLIVYYGSKMHFLRALFSDSLIKESYKLFECNYDPVKKEYLATRQVNSNNIKLSYNKEYLTLLYKNPLLINYTDNHPELNLFRSEVETSIQISPNNIVSYAEPSTKQTSEPAVIKPKDYKSVLFFSDTLILYQNGYYYKPYSVIWSGDMANKRIADALPFDFLPDEKYEKKPAIEVKETDLTDQNTFEIDTIHFAEKVYLHIDRTNYNSGDDIWFKAYVVDALFNKPITNVSNLHVELISASSTIIQSRVLRIEAGIGNGDFHLSDSLPSGSYRIRAYTNFMRNFDDHFFFNKGIFIINPANEANEFNDSTVFIDNKIDISFFPEGGSLVDNVTSILAFKAINTLGKGFDVKGEIYSSFGERITAFESSHLGMGCFLFRPIPGLRYYAIVESKDGAKIKTSLPRSFPEGVVINASFTSDKELLLSINTNENSLPLFIDQDLVLKLSSRNLVTWATKIRISSLINNFIIPLNNYPPGIIRVTLSGTEGLPLCERLVYYQKNNDIYLKVKTDKDIYKPHENIKPVISLSGDTSLTNGAALSFSATEADYTDNYSSWPTSITSWFLLESDVKGSVEEPSYYFDPDNQKRLADIDVLLMTQGWRDFKWKYDTLAAFKHESGFDISGIVKKTINNNLIEDAKINLGLFSANSNEFLNTSTDKEGRFSFNGLNIFGKARAFISSTDENDNSIGKISVNPIKFEPPDIGNVIIDPNIYKLTSRNYSLYVQEASIKLNNLNKYKLSDTLNLGEVFITARKQETLQETRVKESRKIYSTPDKELIMPVSAENFAGDVFGYISGRIPGVRILRGVNSESIYYPDDVMVVIRNQKSSNSKGALILLDGYEIDESSLASILMLPMNIFDRIDVLNASPAYGMRGANGVINIITKTGIRREPQRLYANSVYTSIQGFDVPRIFYSPKYDKQTEQTYTPDYRTTLFWEPNILIKGTGNVTLNFFNADNPSTINIIVEGITRDGIPVAGKATYYVR